MKAARKPKSWPRFNFHIYARPSTHRLYFIFACKIARWNYAAVEMYLNTCGFFNAPCWPPCVPGLIGSRLCQSQFKISCLRAFNKLVFMPLSLISANSKANTTFHSSCFLYTCSLLGFCRTLMRPFWMKLRKFSERIRGELILWR